MSAPPEVKRFDIKASKGYWTPQRDKKLIELVKSYGGRLSWNQLSYAFPGFRGKHLRERYRNHLDPNLKQTPWTWEEDQILKKCYIRFGNCWEHIARHLVGRSANQVKNRIRKKEFRDLFQAPPETTVNIPKSYLPQNFKQPTIFEQQKRIQLKTEHNNKLLRDEIKKQLNNTQSLETVPMPPSLVRLIQKEKKKYSNKTKRFTVTLLHLHRTYKLIRQKINNKDTSQFYSIFEKKTKKEIFAKIQSLQWIICQLWPFVTSRNNTESADQEIAFFLFCLVKANNPLANKLLHRLIKCEDEDYLIRKFQTIIEDIDKFIEQELNSMRDKQILAQNNQQQILKIDVQNDSEELELTSRRVKLEGSTSSMSRGEKDTEGSGPKKRGRKRKGQSLEEGPDIKIMEEKSSNKKAIDLLKLQEDFSFEETESKKSSENNLSSSNYQLLMYGKDIDIGNQLDCSKLKQIIKKQQEDQATVKIQGKGKGKAKAKGKGSKATKYNLNQQYERGAHREGDNADHSDFGNIFGEDGVDDLDLWSSLEDQLDEGLLNKSQQNYSNISDLDFDMTIDPIQQQKPNTFCFQEEEHSKEHQQVSSVSEQNGYKEGQSSQIPVRSNNVMQSFYMKEIIKKNQQNIKQGEATDKTKNQTNYINSVAQEDIKIQQQDQPHEQSNTNPT